MPPEKIHTWKDYRQDFRVTPISPEELREIPTGFQLHPNRPWTIADKMRLYDLVAQGTSESVISQELQRTPEQWHEVYQYYASLQVVEPQTGEWTAEQDAAIVRFIEEYRMTDWDRIAFHLDTTVDEARRYWIARCSRQVASQDTHRKSVITKNLGVSNQITSAMLGALDDLEDDEERTAPQETPITETGSSEPKETTTVQETQSKATIDPAKIPENPARGRKRTRDAARSEESESDAQQPQQKRRLTSPENAPVSPSSRFYTVRTRSANAAEKPARGVKRTREGVGPEGPESDAQQPEQKRQRVVSPKGASVSPSARFYTPAKLPANMTEEPARGVKRTHQSAGLEEADTVPEQPEKRARDLSHPKEGRVLRSARSKPAPMNSSDVPKEPPKKPKQSDEKKAPKHPKVDPQQPKQKKRGPKRPKKAVLSQAANTNPAPSQRRSTRMASNADSAPPLRRSSRMAS